MGRPAMPHDYETFETLWPLNGGLTASKVEAVSHAPLWDATFQGTKTRLFP